MDIVYINKFRYEIQEEMKFRCGLPKYTGPFRALATVYNQQKSVWVYICSQVSLSRTSQSLWIKVGLLILLAYL
jgi:hypothetical protein